MRVSITAAALLSFGRIVRAAIITDPTLISNGTFDYIICGGGLAGLTVASRLTENPGISVLVIEGGNDDHNDTRISTVSSYAQAFGTELDYGFTSEPVASQKNKRLRLVSGHTLGGSGSINGASFTKGSHTQYDLIASIVGDSSWAWNSFNPYMLKAEKFFNASQQEASKGAQYISASHGYNGNVHVSFGEGMFSEVQQQALQSSQKTWSGMKTNPDAASGKTTGTTFFPHMFDDDTNETRSSPYTAYVQNQIPQRSNFTILTGQRVIQITWQNTSNSQNITAEGVKFQACSTCTVYDARVRGEVIVAAGAIQSPQLLELSGVGDPKVLAAANIPLKMALPGVGKNLQEQTKDTMSYKLQSSVSINDSGPSNAIAYPSVQHLFGSNSTAVYNSAMANLSSYAQQLENMGLVVNHTATQAVLEAQINDLWSNGNSSAAAEVLFYINPTARTFNAEVWNLIPLSRGTVHVTNNISWTPPAVSPNYLLHPHDLQTQGTAISQTRQVFQTAPLASLLSSETVPGTKTVPQGSSLQTWENWVSGTFTSVWHYMSTLSMMPVEMGGVVNSRLKVYGTSNVRVVDASIVPIQLSGHLSSTLYGVAEKAAAMIQQDHK